jgi:vitamin B12/bleomycin/antimicrobial peptide transport system ATP-binding/permease protein
VIPLSGLAYFGLAFSRSAGNAIRHLGSTALHRRAPLLIARLDAKIIADQLIAFDLMSDRGSDGMSSPAAGRHRPAARYLHRLPLRRADRAGHGLLGSGRVDRVRVISVALIDRSQPVALLDQMGAVANHALGRPRSDGAWRGELASMLNRVALVAASCGQAAQRATNGRLYVHGGFDLPVAAAPCLCAGALLGGMSFRSHVASSELTAELIGGAS